MSSTTVEKTPVQREARPVFRRLRRGQIIGGVLLVALIIVMVLTALGEPVWQLLGFGTLLLAVVIVVLLALGALLITLGIAALTRKRTRIMPWLERFFRLLLVLGALLAALAGAMFGSQWHTSTPPILGANGRPLPGSIASLEQATLNGSQQWITIRGKNIHNPVLLDLGPGGIPNREYLAPLEEHFVVVSWDQPDTGKSYGGVPLAQLTPQRFVADAYALTQQLRARFHQDKIYLLGQSWSSILGIWLVQKYPELFYAYVGQGQMVNMIENDRMGYQLALKLAAEHGDTTTVDTLRRNGPPPYFGDGLTMKYEAYKDVLFPSMGSPKLILLVPLMPMFSPEYGLLDKVNFVRGFFESHTVVYPQLQGLDFTRSAPRLEVPVYFLVGHHDVIAMAQLTERYYHVLQAPHKELLWFDVGHSGVGSNQLADVLVNRVLLQT